MSNKDHGFTLIEFLVALVIIGFIVSLLVSLFGNPLKESSHASAYNRVMEDIRSISEAVAVYQTKHDGELPDILDKNSDISGLPLVSWPLAPERAFGGAADAVPLYYYLYNPHGVMLCGDPDINDSVIQLFGVSKEVCSLYNKNNSRDHKDGSIPPEEENTGSHCYESGVTGDGKTIYVMNYAAACF